MPERAFVAGAKKGMRPTLTDAVEPVAVGEVRAEECVDPLLDMNAGLPGTTSLHSNKAGEAPAKLCTLPLLAGDSYPTRFRRDVAHGPCWLPFVDRRRLPKVAQWRPK